MENNKCVVTQIIYLLGFSFMFYLLPAVAVEEVVMEPLAETNSMQTYIVWVEKPVRNSLAQSDHEDLESCKADSGGRVEEMEKKDGYISAHPERNLQLHTTHTPNFLGLHQDVGLWKESNYGEGVIIGLLDTGIFPDHPSFGDEGVAPPPAKWKGKCDFSGAVCNNKLIGARSFDGGKTTGGPPVDDEGHGTHTSSTAGGNFVKGAGRVWNG
ncbi:hypothetical protein M0R45_024571 [Rubus argutus]|uniref:Peptidase S8/S53 domain-containing protein n=1 Tax=Rubus argutus TaxID=59490 RepID=A0AAW1WSW0_RUBAR